MTRLGKWEKDGGFGEWTGKSRWFLTKAGQTNNSDSISPPLHIGTIPFSILLKGEKSMIASV